MKMLALDTSSIACSVALQVDDSVIQRYEEQPREHTRLLMPMIESVLHESGVVLSELDAIVLGNGPGSFIGMRIAASVAQGLAFGAGLNIVPVSSLAAVAAQVFDETDAAEVVVAQDAHMSEVYLGMYRRESGMLVETTPEQLHTAAAIAALSVEAVGLRFAAGFGWQRYPEMLAANQEWLSGVADVLHPRAIYLLELAATGVAVKPHAIVPAYLRQRVAQKPTQAS
jgi:tRNA threonylcarbamoyladenosine biosynthesis protein TsaB